MHFLISIGIILAIIGIVLIGMLKWPLKTSDKLLIAILSTFVVKFSFDEASLITGDHLYSIATTGYIFPGWCKNKCGSWIL